MSCMHWIAESDVSPDDLMSITLFLNSETALSLFDGLTATTDKHAETVCMRNRHFRVNVLRRHEDRSRDVREA